MISLKNEGIINFSMQSSAVYPLHNYHLHNANSIHSKSLGKSKFQVRKLKESQQSKNKIFKGFHSMSSINKVSNKKTLESIKQDFSTSPSLLELASPISTVEEISPKDIFDHSSSTFNSSNQPMRHFLSKPIEETRNSQGPDQTTKNEPHLISYKTESKFCRTCTCGHKEPAEELKRFSIGKHGLINKLNVLSSSNIQLLSKYEALGKKYKSLKFSVKKYLLSKNHPADTLKELHRKSGLIRDLSKKLDDLAFHKSQLHQVISTLLPKNSSLDDYFSKLPLHLQVHHAKPRNVKVPNLHIA